MCKRKRSICQTGSQIRGVLMKPTLLTALVLALTTVSPNTHLVRGAAQSSHRMATVSIPLDQLKWTKNPDGTGRETADLFGDRRKAELFGYLVAVLYFVGVGPDRTDQIER